MFKNNEPKTVYDQQLDVSAADRQRAQEAFNIAKQLQKEGQNTAAENYRQIGRDILGLNLIQGTAHGEMARVQHKKGKTETGEEYNSVEAHASNPSKLPEAHKVDHRRAVAMTSRGSLDNNPQMLKTTANFFADNAIKIVKTIGRGLRKTFSTTWHLYKKGSEIQKAKKMLRERERKLIDNKMNELDKGSSEVVLSNRVRSEAQKIEDKEWERRQKREAELRNAEVLTVYKGRKGKIYSELSHEEPPPPWRTE